MIVIITAVLLTGDLLMPLPAAADENESQPQQLDIHHNDVTGNNIQETVKLLGTSLAPDSNYHTTVKANITNSDGDNWKIAYEGGYNPGIEFFDLNHNNVNDLLYQSETGNSNLQNYHLHTLKDGQLAEIQLPEQQSVKAEFKDDFQIAVQVDHEQEPSIIDATDKASDYIKMGIYKENGKVKSDSISPLIAPIAAFEPVQISDSQGYGLKSHQQISGADRSDKLGTVETLWYYEKDQWIILKTDWIPSN